MKNWLIRGIQRTASMARKEFVHIFMDPGALFLTVFAPTLVLIMLAYAFSIEGGDTRIAVIDLDQSDVSAAYQRQISSDGSLDIVARPSDTDAAETLMEAGRIDAFLVIPPGFGGDLAASQYPAVQVVVDGVSASPQGTLAAIEGRTRRFAAEMTGTGEGLIDVRTRSWFNENLNASHSMVPGLMAIVLILPAMSVALGMTREKELGTLETLVTTPLMPENVLVGKLIVYMTMGVVSGLLALVTARLIFGVPFRGSLPLWMLVTACYLMAIMALSLLIAQFTRSQQTAIVVILIATFIPGFKMSGLLDPIDPGWTVSSIFSRMLPMTYYIEASRGLALKALPFSLIWVDVAVLAAMGFIGVLIAVLLFEKKVG